MNPMYYRPFQGAPIVYAGHDARRHAYNYQPQPSSVGQNTWSTDPSQSRGGPPSYYTAALHHPQVSQTDKSNTTRKTVDGPEPSKVLTPRMREFLSPLEPPLKQMGSSLDRFLNHAKLEALMKDRRPSRMSHCTANQDIAFPFVTGFAAPMDILFGSESSTHHGNTLLYLTVSQNIKWIEKLGLSEKKVFADCLIGYFESHRVRFLEPFHAINYPPYGKKYRMVSYTRVIVHILGMFSKVCKDRDEFHLPKKAPASHSSKKNAASKQPQKICKKALKFPKAKTKIPTNKLPLASSKRTVQRKDKTPQKAAEKENVDTQECSSKPSQEVKPQRPKFRTLQKREQDSVQVQERDKSCAATSNPEMKELQMAAAWITPPLHQIICAKDKCATPKHGNMDILSYYQTSCGRKIGVVQAPLPVFFQDY